MSLQMPFYSHQGKSLKENKKFLFLKRMCTLASSKTKFKMKLITKRWYCVSKGEPKEGQSKFFQFYYREYLFGIIPLYRYGTSVGLPFNTMESVERKQIV